MTSENTDYPRPNQLWQCGRAGDCSGCTAGPTRWGVCRQSPRCSPKLSVRGRRGVFVAACAFATLGLLLVGFFHSTRNSLAKPGPLSAPHQQALQQIADSERCTACHDAADADPLVWLAIASGNAPARFEGQAVRCLKCHAQSLDIQWAHFAHNVSPESLAARTAAIPGATRGLDDLLRVKFAGKGEIACATCHHEHHGSHQSLTQLTDHQCQACHKSEFTSLADGHPEFRHTLPSRRSRIAFDHVAHHAKHFPEKQQDFDCGRCHVNDAQRDVKRLEGFQKSCAACHEGPIRATTLDGIVAFSLPTLDLASLLQAGHDIGDWPKDAQGDFDGAIPPTMLLLLMVDLEAAAALEQLGADFDFAQTESPAELEAVAALAWSYKRLLNDLADDSEGALRARIASLAPENKPPSELETVLRQLPAAMFREARRRWLPGLSHELAARDRARSRPAAAVSSSIYPQVREAPARELLIENPLAKRSDTPGQAPQAAANPPSLFRATETLAENPLSRGNRPANHAVPEPSAIPSEIPATPSDASLADPGQLASSGTWYLDDDTLSVRYRPRGHADELQRLLIDVAAASTVPHEGLLPAMLRDASFKACAGCHSIDTSGDHYAINWHTQYRDTSRRQFTHFSHRPHLVQPRLADCSHCHRLTDVAEMPSDYHANDPMAHSHDFQPIVKATCVVCHAGNESTSSCTTCHSYHVGSIRRFGK